MAVNITQLMHQPISKILTKTEFQSKIQENFEDFCRLGHLFLIREKYDNAEKLFAALLDKFPHKWELIHALAIALLNQHKTRRALTYLRILQQEYKNDYDPSIILDEIEEASLDLPEDHLYFMDFKSQI